MTDESRLRKRRILPLILWGLLVLAVLFLLAVFGLWTARKGLVSNALGKYCSERGLNCTAEIQQVGMKGALVSDLVIRSADKAPFKAETISLDYTLAGLGVPKISQIRIDAPDLRLTHDGKRLGFNGLEALLPKQTNKGGAIPHLQITDGRVLIDTPAGEIAAALNLNGTLPQEGSVRIELAPAILNSGSGEVSLQAGLIVLTISDQQVAGDAKIRLEAARYGEMAVSNLDLTANLIGEDGASGPLNASWQGSVAEARFPGGSTIATSTSGTASFAGLPQPNLTSLRAELDALSAQLTTGPVAIGQMSAASAKTHVVLTRKAGGLGGPVRFELADMKTTEMAASAIDLDGTLALPSGREAISFDGTVKLASADIASARTRKLLQALDVPAPFDDHGRALKSALLRGGQNFDTAFNADIQWEAGRLRLRSAGKTSLRATSGLTATIQPAPQTDWLTFARGNLQLQGDLTLQGGSVPNLAMALETFQTGQDGFRIKARNIALAPWRAGGKSLAMQLGRLDMTRQKGLTNASIFGKITVAGDLPGVVLGSTSLKGGIHATNDARGWLMQVEGQECLDFASEGFDFGGLEVLPVDFGLCPQEGHFIRQSDGTPQGSIRLGDLIAPFKTKSGLGELKLDGATVDWSANQGLVMTISANALHLPLTIGTRTLSIDGKLPSIGAIAGSGPLRLSARLSDVDFGGSLIPANVSAAAFRFDGRSTARGITGKLLGNGVRIEDNHASPFYQPLVADLSGDLRDRQLTMTGPVRLARGGITIADTYLDIDLLSLNGSANIRSRDLVFRETGLQPVMLSDRLRGFFTYATGRVEGAADFIITRGKLAGTGRFAANEFGFQTTRFGRVEGINGEISFNDLLALTTPPDQTVRIRRINPGVPLENGEMVFQLLGPRSARLQTARFPFAGGQLLISPATWTIGGDKQIVQVEASKIELAELISALKLPDIEARGTVSGRFPIEIANSSVYVRGASLKVDERGGQLSYTGDIGDAAATQNEKVALAFEALKDFRYTILELGLDGDVSDEMLVTMRIIGNNPDVLDGQMFDFNIGVASDLAELIQSRQYYGDQKWLKEIIAEEIRSGSETPAETVN